MGAIFDPPQIRELKAQIRSDLCRVINAMSQYEVLMNAPFHEDTRHERFVSLRSQVPTQILLSTSAHLSVTKAQCSFSSLF